MDTFSPMCLFAVELICQSLHILTINVSICITSEVRYESVFLCHCSIKFSGAESSVLPGSKYELSIPVPSTHSHSVSIHTVHPQGTTERKRKKIEKSDFFITPKSVLQDHYYKTRVDNFNIFHRTLI